MKTLKFLIGAGLLCLGAFVFAQDAAKPLPSVDPKKVAAGERQAKKMLLLMDTDKSGKVSKAEFMTFMEAEFERLDINKDGELDVKELTQSQVHVVRGRSR